MTSTFWGEAQCRVAASAEDRRLTDDAKPHATDAQCGVLDLLRQQADQEAMVLL
jgi:hypothetical protein